MRLKIYICDEFTEIKSIIHTRQSTVFSIQRKKGNCNNCVLIFYNFLLMARDNRRSIKSIKLMDLCTEQETSISNKQISSIQSKSLEQSSKNFDTSRCDVRCHLTESKIDNLLCSPLSPELITLIYLVRMSIIIAK